MTSPDHWRRLEEVFRAALDIPPDQREAWLTTACRGDAELRREVDNLLARDLAGSSRIAGIIEFAAASMLEESPLDGSPPDGTSDPMAGLELGSYRILREIGRGGMGAVYLATRADQAFDKQVAIKLVKRGIDTDAVLQRFRYERRILAALEHPYIAHLVDGGTSPDGRPYFVMEYVDGKPLDFYAAEQNLSIAQRCELLRKVCEAVSYAHCNLIIHRDLKPANVLVTADGAPKLLDFGIARLLSVDSGENTLMGPAVTRALTPAFASPEQMNGEAVTTATDVYSLGATLKAILPAARELPADLATILQKAMREEPGQRYSSVAELSEDLRRYLAGLPILARHQGVFYRAGKFVRRHRSGMAVFAVLTVLGIAAIADIVRQSHRADSERAQAEQRLSQAVDMAERALADVNNSIASLPGTTGARRQMVRSTLDYLDQLSRDSGNDPRVRLALATAYIRVGEVLGNQNFTNLGDTAGSLATYRKALGLIDGLLARTPRDAKTLDLAEVAHQGAGNILNAMGRTKESESEYRSAIALADGNLALDPHNPQLQDRSLDAHYALDFQICAGDPKAVQEDLIKQLPLAKSMADQQPGDLTRQDILSEYDSLLGTALVALDRTQDAAFYFRQAVGIREEVYRRDPRNTRYQRDLMIGYGHMADILGSPMFSNLGDYAGALKYYRQAESMVEEMIRNDPSDNRAALDLGMVWTRIGITQTAAGDFTASNRSLDRAIAQFDILLKNTPDSASYRGGIMLAYDYRGRNMRRLGDFASALEWERKNLDFSAKLLKEGRSEPTIHMMHIVALEQVAVLRAAMGQREDALKLASQAIGEAHDTFTQRGYLVSLAQSWYRYGLTHEILRDCETARSADARSAELLKQSGPLTAWRLEMLRHAEQVAAHCSGDPASINLRNLP